MPNLDGMNKDFVLFKKKDLHYLTGEEYEQFLGLQDSVFLGLLRDKKNTNKSYIVIDTDKPYANEMMEIMKHHGDWDEGRY